MSDSTPPASSSFNLLKQLLRELLAFVEEVERMGSLINLRPDLPPVWSLPASITLTAGGSGVDLRQYVTDPDQTDPLISVFSGTLPAGVQLIDGVLSALSNALAASAEVEFRAQDIANNKAQASTTVAVEVPVTNRAPYWLAIPSSFSIIPPGTIDLSTWARDDDLGDALTYSVFAGSLPAPATLNPQTGLITFPTGFPGQTLVGLQFRITDPGGLPATTGPVSVALGGKPVWVGPSSLTLQRSQIVSTTHWFQSAEAFSVSIAPSSAPLPQGVTFASGNLICASDAAAAAVSGVVFRAISASGLVTDSPAMNISIVLPSAGGLSITQTMWVRRDVHNGSIFWNTAKVDKRGGIIGWADGNHAPTESTANSVRLYNLGTVTWQGIAPGASGFLLAPSPFTAAGTARIAEEDNYPFYYFPSDDKWFWGWTPYNLADAGITGNQFGIYDMASNQWEYGNNGNPYGSGLLRWPDGPYWQQYISTAYLSAGVLATKNAAHGISEMLDMSIAHYRDRFFIIERNPFHPLVDTQPRRMRYQSISAMPYKANASIGFNSDEQNQFQNSGFCVGVWFYFIKQATLTERQAFPDPRGREFWKVNMTDHTQFKQLAHFPALTINPIYNEDGSEYTSRLQPLMGYDDASNNLVVLFDKVWFYDIDADAWTDRTPANYVRTSAAVGGIVRKDQPVRTFAYRGATFGLNGPDGTSRYWNHVDISGGIKPRARFVPRVLLPNTGPAGVTGATNPWRGKHLRLIYSRKWNHASGAAGVGGYVWQFGGDYTGSPSDPATGYPPRVAGSEAWSIQSSRQDAYRAKVEEVGGAVEMDMTSNFCAFYPYPGGPDPLTTTLGPVGPDGVVAVFDKRGDAWVGPCYSRFASIYTNPPVSGPAKGGMMPVFRFRLPAEINGVRQGNGWYQPPQNRLHQSGQPIVNPDDLFVGSAGGLSISGVSNNWGAYDEKEDCTVMMARNTFGTAHLYKFALDPALPILADGVAPTPGVKYRYRWTRTNVTRNKSHWFAFLNTQVRAGGAPFVGDPADQYHGAHAVVRDHLYVVSHVRGSGHATRISYLTRWNLRDLTELPTYIALPTLWVRGWDMPDNFGKYDSADSVPEYRDIQRLGHLIVLSPAYEGQYSSDPWLHWYNTNTGQWTVGQSYDQMRVANPSLPAYPGDFDITQTDDGPVPSVNLVMNKGGFCTVEETGEAWVNAASSQMLGNGIIKYRLPA